MSLLSKYTFVCKTCNKNYKSKQSLWNHKNKYHIHQNPPISTIILQNPTKHHQIPPNNNKYQCEYCLNIFSRNDSLNRHYTRCKIKKSNQNSNDEIIDMLKNTVKQQSEENKEIKKTLMEIINKKCKIHPKTLQKINKQLNIDNNGIINENNGTINNNNITYNIIGFGHENLSDVFSKKEKLKILKHKYCSLPHLVEYAHFNDKYPQFKNILITNTQNKLAYKYDIKSKQFIAINKDELLEDIVDARMCDISSFYDELEEELDTKTKDILDKVKDKIDSDPAYKELKKQDIKLIIYNNRKKVSKENIREIEV